MKNRFFILIFTAALLVSGCDYSYSSLSSKHFTKILVKKYEVYGGNSLDISKALAKIKDQRVSNNWETIWAETARNYEEAGNKHFGNNNIEDAIYNTLKASVYYRIASLPFPESNSQKEYYKKSVTLHQNSVKFLDNPPEIIRIPFETKKIVGYLRLPGKGKRYPLVVLLPGIDGTKEEFFWIEDWFLAKGFAVFSMDIPGVGDSEWTLRLDSERVFAKTFSYLKTIPDIMPDKISIIGFNFGAYWALRIAAKEQESVKNVIAVTPPLNYAFSKERLINMPKFLKNIFMLSTGETKIEPLNNTLHRFSLADSDILRDIKANIFLVSIKDDLFVPKEDIEYLAIKSRKPINYKLYKNEQFSVVENLASFWEMASSWLEENS